MIILKSRLHTLAQATCFSQSSASHYYPEYSPALRKHLYPSPPLSRQHYSRLNQSHFFKKSDNLRCTSQNGYIALWEGLFLFCAQTPPTTTPPKKKKILKVWIKIIQILQKEKRNSLTWVNYPHKHCWKIPFLLHNLLCLCSGGESGDWYRIPKSHSFWPLAILFTNPSKVLRCHQALPVCLQSYLHNYKGSKFEGF